MIKRLYKPVFKTTKKNKEVNELQPWWGAYQELRPIWACLNKLLSPSSKLKNITRDFEALRLKDLYL